MEKLQGKSSTKAKNKYNAKAYDRIALQVKKGTKDIIKNHAEKQGESLNGYIKKAVADRYKDDTGDEIDL